MTISRHKLGAGMLASVVVLIGGTFTLLVGQSWRESPRVLDANQFWGALRLEGANEVESFPTLRRMRDSADTVVLGRMVRFGVSRTVQGDAPEDRVTYAAADFVVDETLRGAAVGRTVSVELLMPQAPNDVDAAVAALSASVPAEPALLLVRKKRDGSGRLRLVNFAGLWTNIDGKLTAPLTEDEGRFAVETAGFASA